MFDYLKHFEIKLVLTFDILLLAKQQLKNVILIFDKVIWDNNNAFLQWVNDRLDLVWMNLLLLHVFHFLLVIISLFFFNFINWWIDIADEQGADSTNHKVRENKFIFYPKFVETKKLMNHSKIYQESIDHLKSSNNPWTKSFKNDDLHKTYLENNAKQHDKHVDGQTESVLRLKNISHLKEDWILLDQLDIH